MIAARARIQSLESQLKKEGDQRCLLEAQVEDLGHQVDVLQGQMEDEQKQVKIKLETEAG